MMQSNLIRRAEQAPPRMCSSASVSPKRSGGAATVPRSSSASFWINASRKMRPCMALYFVILRAHPLL